MAALTVVFDLDGTLVDTAPDLIDTLNVVFAREGLPPVDYAAARNMIGGGARRMIESGAASSRASRCVRRRRRSDVRRFHRALRGPHRRPIAAVPGPRRSTRPPGRTRLPLCGLHQQARRIVAAAARCARPHAGALPRSAARTHSACKSRTRRSCGGRSGRPAATLQRAVMVGDSGTDIATARAAGVPVVAVDFGYSETPITDLGPDRLISHFDELAEAVLELAPPDAGNGPNVPQKPRLSLYLLYLAHTGRRGFVPAATPTVAGSPGALPESTSPGGPLSDVTRPLGCMSGRY